MANQIQRVAAEETRKKNYINLCYAQTHHHSSMALNKKTGSYILSLFCLLQSLSVIGFCLYKLCTDTDKSEIWLAIICSVLGCVSSKAHLSSTNKNVVLSRDPVRLES